MWLVKKPLKSGTHLCGVMSFAYVGMELETSFPALIFAGFTVKEAIYLVQPTGRC